LPLYSKLRRERLGSIVVASSSVHTITARWRARDALELDQAPHHGELREVFLSPEGAEHAGEVAGRGDGGTEPAADRLPNGPAKVLVAASALGEGNDVHLAVVSLNRRRAGERLDGDGSGWRDLALRAACIAPAPILQRSAGTTDERVRSEPPSPRARVVIAGTVFGAGLCQPPTRSARIGSSRGYQLSIVTRARRPVPQSIATLPFPAG